MATTNNKSAMPEKPVWFITGCSTGFGHELAKHVLECGHRAVLAARNPEGVSDLTTMGEALVLKLDVTDQDQVDASIKTAENKFGPIDILVNNAGIGYFAINVSGLSRMIHAVLPGMRKRHKGFIVNISSIDGIHTLPLNGYYNATKFAIKDLSEALLRDVEADGIKVMLVEAGGYRTNWAKHSVSENEHQLDDYAATTGAYNHQAHTISGKQPDDSVHAAHAIVKAIGSMSPPYHLLLGNDAFEGAVAKAEVLRDKFPAWEALALGANLPGEKPEQEFQTVQQKFPEAEQPHQQTLQRESPATQAEIVNLTQAVGRRLFPTNFINFQEE
jgi:NADP-dependent 3-hydroxy acid dehydrogenase YdfG